MTATSTLSEPLTAADRCDRCGAQAYVRVRIASGELFFCGHHAQEFLPAFGDTATHVHDERDRLLAEPGAAVR